MLHRHGLENINTTSMSLFFSLTKHTNFPVVSYYQIISLVMCLILNLILDLIKITTLMERCQLFCTNSIICISYL